MQSTNDFSPEARRRRAAAIRARFGSDVERALRPDGRPLTILKRVGLGLYQDGFIHAGNLAYLSIVSLFPFLILATAVTQLLGNSADGARTVATILQRLPPDIRSVLSAPIQEVLTLRTGPLLWAGAAVGLWTAASYIETIRDILRRAYGVKYSAPFYTYRLMSIGVILGAVVLLMIAFGATVAMASVHEVITRVIPASEGVGHMLGLYRLVPPLTLFLSFYLLFVALTPKRYRSLKCRKWPGALLVTSWWLATAWLLPKVIALFGGYGLTYGSLAGVVVTLLFFFIVGLGVVAGAELNAAIANPGSTALEGEEYSGPFRDELEVVAPAEDEAVSGAPVPAPPVNVKEQA